MDEINLKINEKEVPLTHFPKTLIISAIMGMLQVLKDVDVIKSVEIKITKGQ
jgi:hypothetical protein